MEIYILFEIINEYYQPERSFVKLFWSKPTKEEVEAELHYKLTEEEFTTGLFRADDQSTNYIKNKSHTQYWIEKFVKP